MAEFEFDMQRFWRDSEDIEYRGRRRWAGNWGRLIYHSRYVSF